MAVHRIVRGLDVPLEGAPEQAIHPAPRCSRVALLAEDYPGLKARVHVQPGEAVLRGQPLFEDRRSPGVPFTAPAAGHVADIVRGAQRALRAVVLEVGAHDAPQAQVSIAHGAVRARLIASGLWTALRTRPYSHVPAADAVPHALFVTAMDSHPLAPRPEVVLADRLEDFARGLRALAELCPGPTYLCVAAGSPLAAPAGSRIRREEFAGPHPAGTPGVHINRLAPVDRSRSVWHIGYQDVAAIGQLLGSGVLDVHRVIALGGPGARAPRLLRARMGAATEELARGEAHPGALRIASGSLLEEREAPAFLGRFHRQITLLRAPAPAPSKGGPLVPIEAYDAVMPLDVQSVVLLRALLAQDLETAEQHGCLDLDEEDLALASYVCPAGNAYGPLLRRTLERLHAEG